MKNNEKKFNAKRRVALKKSLKSAAVGGVVAAMHTWERPIVENMVLPAHAQTSGKVLAVSNITIQWRDGTPFLNVNNPDNGTNFGALTGGSDYSDMDVNGVITPPPPAGTVVDISAVTAQEVDSHLDNCLFADRDVCSISLPVNSTNGDFSLLAERVNGLDDNRPNEVTVTLSCIDSPPFVLRFTSA